MAGTPTTNYKIPTYAASDTPDLTGAYNSAMAKIDAELKNNANAASTNATAISTANGKITTNANDISSLKTTTSTHTSQISSINSEINAIKASTFVPSTSDKALTVQQLGQAKVTSSGIVYFKASQA